MSKYLAEHGVVVEKTGLYSFFILFTIGITKGRWNTLVAALQQFKDDYERNQPLWRVMPEFCAKHPRYEGMGLRDLSQHVHALYAKYDVARLSTEIYLSDHHPAMTPTEAFAALDAGATGLKLFPGELIGPMGLRAMRAVLPQGTECWAVGGVSAPNMAEWRQAGAAGFGIGSALYKPGDSAVVVAEKARAMVAAWSGASAD